MKIAEALIAMYEGKIVETCDADGSNFYLRSGSDGVKYTSTCHGINNSWTSVGNNELFWMAKSDYRIYQPKSKIEEAIERECQTGDPIVILSRFQASQAMRRIVNVALDEAIRAIKRNGAYSPTACEAIESIDALRVKE